MNELTDEKLTELRTIAEETWPGGEWVADGYDRVYAEDGQQVYAGDCCGDGTSPAAEHIAAFDPPTVLALLAEVERLQAKVAAFADIEEAHNASYRMLRDQSGMTELADELQRRLDAVLKLHVWHDCPDPGCNFAIACNACNHPFPCPTVKAARGEQ